MKFKKYDHVRIAKDLGPTMDHFTKGCNAIVVEVGTKDSWGESYGLHIEGKGYSAWYHDHQLTLIAHNRKGLLKKWEAAEKKLEEQQGDLDWIFKNGKAILRSASGASVCALAKEMGLTNLWGSHGEGMTYYMNALRVLDLSKPFLINRDKKGWLTMAHEIRDKQHAKTAC